MTAEHTQHILDPEAREFYCHTMGVLEQAGIDVLVGGAYAFAQYTDIERHTKDFDVFVKGDDFDRTLNALEQAGYQTEIPFPHWLGKAYSGQNFVDVIYGSGNGVARVDDEWFDNAPQAVLFDLRVRLCPAEEMLWTKALIQERERFDGADVAHLLLACAQNMDWQRLIRRFGPHWRVLLSHLVLFGFIYPSQRERVPGWVMQDLLRRLEDSMSAPAERDRICHGTLLSRQQYLYDVEQKGWLDARLLADNPMTGDDIANWTAAIERDGASKA